ncbi:MAG: DUF819 family protein [Planctomycetes bacterium]|nr:DUF819 family protein [Planctomycetota bacterium]
MLALSCAPTLLLLAQTVTSAPAATSAAADPPPLITDPAGILAILLVVLAGIFWLTQHRVFGRLFKVVPALVFCYFVPTTLTTLGVIPDSSALYSWIKSFVLPASLLLLILALDVPGIIRLGPKAVIMLLAGTTGVVLGGPLALLVCREWLPSDAWQGMTALAGSWIGGGANFVALGEIAGTSNAMLATMVIPDVFVANIWMGVLLYLSGHQRRVDAWTGANVQAIRALERRMTDFQERVMRIPALSDLMIILAFGFAGSWLSYRAGLWLPEIGTAISHSTWKYIIITAVGVILSFTPVRNLEGAGASRIGSVMIYLLVACIGASADFAKIVEAPAFILMGFIWISVHIFVLLVVGWLIKAPIFFVAVGSQANIGGAASAPIVAAAYHPSLAPVGVLLAVAGYVLGTYAGLVCMKLLQTVAGHAPLPTP